MSKTNTKTQEQQFDAEMDWLCEEIFGVHDKITEGRMTERDWDYLAAIAGVSKEDLKGFQEVAGAPPADVVAELNKLETEFPELNKANRARMAAQYDRDLNPAIA